MIGRIALGAVVLAALGTAAPVQAQGNKGSDS